MKSKFVAIVDSHFSKVALNEIRSKFPNVKVKMFENYASRQIFLLRDSENKENPQFKCQKFSYIDNCFPLFAVLRDVDPEYYVVLENVLNILLLLGKKRFKLEVEKLGFHTTETAKDIEVKIGKEIESRGFIADLTAPEIQVYIILTRKGAIVGAESSKTKQILDIFRHFNKSKSQHLNRSEFKLIEAVEYFDININANVKSCIDVGASPGGWTHFLLNNKVKVLAVDHAPLEYKLLPTNHILVVLDRKYSNHTDLTTDQKAKIDTINFQKLEALLKEEQSIFDKYDLVHLRLNISERNIQDLFKSFGKFDMLAIDINKEPRITTRVACMLSPQLRKNAFLLITIKMPENKPEYYVKIAEDSLKESYSRISYKKLQHNRQEFTLFARKLE